MEDTSKIGQSGIQDPNDAIKQKEGSYNPPTIPDQDKLFTKQLPQVNCPVPFGNLSTPSSGSR